MEDQRRAGRAVDDLLQRELRGFGLDVLLADELLEGSQMPFVGIARHHRIDEHHEIGFRFGHHTRRSGQIAARRGARNPHLVRIDAQLAGHFAHRRHRFVQVVERHLRMAVGQTVFEHHAHDAVLGEPLAGIVAVGDRELRVAAARAEYDRLPRRLFGCGLVDPDFGRRGVGQGSGFALVFVTRHTVRSRSRRIVPQFDVIVLRRYGHRREEQRRKNRQSFHLLSFYELLVVM